VLKVACPPQKEPYSEADFRRENEALLRWTGQRRQRCTSFLMLITSSDFARVTYAPKAVWARLTRGPESEETPGARLIGRVRYNQANDRFGEWVVHELGHVRNLTPLFDLSWPESNECYEGVARDALANGEPVVGTHFRSGNCVAAPDVLVPEDGERVGIILVDCTTEPNTDRCALKALFTRSVLEKNGLLVGSIRLFGFNPLYVEGQNDGTQLFQEFDLRSKVQRYEPEVTQRFEQLEALTHLTEPPERLDEYCPRVDDATLPASHVFLLKNGSKRAGKARTAGITELKDIPLDKTIRDSHRIQIQSAQTGQRHIDTERLREFIGRLRYPLHSLDFETMSTPLPLFEGSRPHQTIPVQFSLHTREAPGRELLRSHFIHRAASDPRPALLEALRKSLPPQGSVLVYSKGCEENVLKELGRDFPEFKGFSDQVIPRLVDLYDVFRGFMMYDPGQLGKTRFKKVLDCFAGKSYEGLRVKNGEMATCEYQRVTHEVLGPVAQEERAAVYRGLEIYCDQDSWGQHELVDVIQQLSGARIGFPAGKGLAREAGIEQPHGLPRPDVVAGGPSVLLR
jgi:Domain of unknown function(DUF2779)